MTTKSYYPLPAASSAPPVSFGIKNMWDTLADAVQDAIQRATSNPSGSLAVQFSAVVAGGIPPYTYAWSLGGSAVAISNQAISDPVFSASGTGVPDSKKSSFTLTATDSTTPTPLTDTKYLDIQFFFGGGIP